MKFGTRGYPVQKYAVREYLHHDILDTLFDYTLDQYELPKMTENEVSQARDMFIERAPDMSKAIFSNEQVTRKFIRYLEKNVAFNGRDTFSYTCRTLAENGDFIYIRGAKKKHLEERNRAIVRVLNPVLDQLSNGVALGIEETLTDIRSNEKNQEMKLAEEIVAKHGGTLSWGKKRRP